MQSIREIVIAEIRRRGLTAYRLAFLINACKACHKRGQWQKDCLYCGGPRPRKCRHLSRSQLAAYLAGKTDMTGGRLERIFAVLGLKVTRRSPTAANRPNQARSAGK